MILFKIVKFVNYALLNKMFENVKNILKCNQQSSAVLFYCKIKIIEVPIGCEILVCIIHRVTGNLS